MVRKNTQILGFEYGVISKGSPTGDCGKLAHVEFEYGVISKGSQTHTGYERKRLAV